MPQFSRTPLEPAWLYRFFDDQERLLYVGITQKLGHRFSAHDTTPWWSLARHVTVTWHSTWLAAAAAEAEALRTEAPIHIRQHSGIVGLVPVHPGSRHSDPSLFAPTDILRRAGLLRDSGLAPSSETINLGYALDDLRRCRTDRDILDTLTWWDAGYQALYLLGLGTDEQATPEAVAEVEELIHSGQADRALELAQDYLDELWSPAVVD